jgi:CRP-like cAMP-binding protein
MSPGSAGIDATLRASRLFGQLDDALLAELSRSAVRRRYARGDVIWRAGDPATSVTIIATGLVKICQPRGEKDSAIVGLFGPRESVGDVAVVSLGTYPADAIAASDVVELLCVDKAPVLAAMTRDVALSLAVNRSLVDHTTALREKIRIMTAGPVDERLAALLSHLAHRFGDELEDGSVVIPVSLSRTELACLVGATVETVIRTMSRWQKEGAVSTTETGFVLHDPERFAIEVE